LPPLIFLFLLKKRGDSKRKFSGGNGNFREEWEWGGRIVTAASELAPLAETRLFAAQPVTAPQSTGCILPQPVAPTNGPIHQPTVTILLRTHFLGGGGQDARGPGRRQPACLKKCGLEAWKFFLF
jgi:hypothetical protein